MTTAHRTDKLDEADAPVTAVTKNGAIMYRSAWRLRDEVRSMMSEVKLTDLTADELLGIIAVLAPARVRIRAHQPNNVIGLSSHRS